MAKDNNNKFWLKLVISISMILIAAAVAYGVLNEKVNHNCITIQQHEKRIKLCEEAIIEWRAIRKAIERMEEKR